MPRTHITGRVGWLIAANGAELGGSLYILDAQNLGVLEPVLPAVDVRSLVPSHSFDRIDDNLVGSVADPMYVLSPRYP